MDSSVVSGCSSQSGGGGLYLWHAYAEARRSNFTDNSAPEGAAFQVEGGAATRACPPGSIGCALSAALVDGCQVRDNRAGGAGAGVNCRGAVTLSVAGSNFSANAAGARGGAIHFSSPAEALTVQGSEFSGNEAGAGGGAISVTGASSVSLSASRFAANRALSGDGGGVEVVDAPATSLCVMGAAQTVRGTKGALAVTGGNGMPTVVDFTCSWTVAPENVLFYEDCVVEARRAPGSSRSPPLGLVHASSHGRTDALPERACSRAATPFTQLDIVSVEIVAAINPTSPTMAVRVVDARSAQPLFSCSGLLCDLSARGGAATVRSSSDAGLTVSYSWVSTGDDIGMSYGLRAAWRAICGAAGQDRVSGDLLSVSVLGSSFEGNAADDGNGGGLSLVAVEKFSRGRLSVVTVADSAFTGNAALGSGGGLYAPSRLNVTARNVTGRLNEARLGQGGCAYFGNVSLISICDSVCSSNAAGAEGGGLHVGGGATVQIRASEVCDNAAATGGGLSLGPDVTAAAVGCAIRGNVAASAGGACALLRGTHLDVSSSVVADNVAGDGGGAFFLLGRSALTLRDGTVLSNNSAFLGGVIAFADALAAQSAVSLSGLALLNNSATAGALFGLLRDSAPFPVPQCSNCTVLPALPLSYGPEAATPPVRFQANVSYLHPGDFGIEPGDPVFIGLGAILPHACAAAWACLPPPPSLLSAWCVRLVVFFFLTSLSADLSPRRRLQPSLTRSTSASRRTRTFSSASRASRGRRSAPRRQEATARPPCGRGSPKDLPPRRRSARPPRGPRARPARSPGRSTSSTGAGGCGCSPPSLAPPVRMLPNSSHSSPLLTRPSARPPARPPSPPQRRRGRVPAARLRHPGNQLHSPGFLPGPGLRAALPRAPLRSGLREGLRAARALRRGEAPLQLHRRRDAGRRHGPLHLRRRVRSLGRPRALAGRPAHLLSSWRSSSVGTDRRPLSSLPLPTLAGRLWTPPALRA